MMNGTPSSMTAGPQTKGQRRHRRLLCSSFIRHLSSVRHGAFTFAELLAAMVFMAIVIPVAVQALIISNRAGAVAEHKRVAVQLADRLLTEMVVTDDWRTSEREGDFGEDWPAYRWVLDDAVWDQDTMQVVTVEVFFEIQGREYSVALSTLVDETEEEAEE